MEEKGKVTRSAGVIGISVLISRITGLIREMVIAGVFGAGPATDAFFVAFRIPYTLRQLFAEGGMNVAFIPVLSEYKAKRKKEDIEKFIGNVLMVFSIVLIGIILIVELFPGIVVDIFAYGFSKNPGIYDLTVFLTRMVFPYIWLISMTVLLGGVLNTYGYFFAPAISQALLNLSIATFGYFLGRTQFGLPPVTSLAFGVLVGGLSQLLLQVVYFPKTSLKVPVTMNFKDPGVIQVAKLLVPAALGMMVYQLNTLVSTQLASFLAEGSVSYLYYADRLMQLPIGVFSFALSTAALPTLSVQSAESEHDKAAELLLYSMKMNFILVLPVMILYLLLADEIVDILYRRGAFSLASTMATASALRMYAIGLWSASSVRVLAPFFYSRKEPYVPLRSGMISLTLNFILGIILMKYISFRGLALAIAVASMGNFIYLWISASKRHSYLKFSNFFSLFLKLLIALSLLTFVVIVSKFSYPYPLKSGIWVRLLWLTVVAAVAFLIYGFILYLLKVDELRYLLSGMKRRLRK